MGFINDGHRHEKLHRHLRVNHRQRSLRHHLVMHHR